MSRGTSIAIALLGIGLAMPAHAGSWSQSRHGMSVMTENDTPVRSCGDIRVLFGNRDAERA